MNYKNSLTIIALLVAMPVFAMEEDQSDRKRSREKWNEGFMGLFDGQPEAEKRVKPDEVGGTALIKRMHDFYCHGRTSENQVRKNVTFCDVMPAKVHKGIFPGVAQMVQMGAIQLPRQTVRGQQIEYHVMADHNLRPEGPAQAFGKDFQNPIIEAAGADDMERLMMLCKPQYQFPCEIKLIEKDRINKALLSACFKGHLKAARYLIEVCKADASFVFKDTSVVRFACDKGHLPVVQYLIEERGVDPNEKNSYGATLLHTACDKGHLSVVRYLIEQCKADVDAKTFRAEMSPLGYACSSGHLPIVQYLIEQCKADINTQDKEGLMPLHRACQFGHLLVVQYLIEQSKAGIDAQDNLGAAPLHVACAGGHLPVVQYLIDQCKADVNARDKADWMPLHRACQFGHLPVVQHLIEQCKADVNAKNNLGRTPLFAACEFGHLLVVEYLIKQFKQCKVDLEIIDNAGVTLLHIACAGGFLSIVRYMLEQCKMSIRVKAKRGFGLYDAILAGMHKFPARADEYRSLLQYLKKQMLPQDCPICLDTITPEHIVQNKVEFACNDCLALMCSDCKAKLVAARGQDCPQCRKRMFGMEATVMEKVSQKK